MSARVLFLLPLLLSPCVYGMEGKVMLANGRSLAGDVRKNADGGCTVVLPSGSITFGSDEVRRVVIYSKRDTARDRFISSFNATPKTSVAARPAAPSTPYDGIIHQAARKNNIDPALVKAVMKAESNFNPRDTSNKGACGLMQLMPDTARILGVRDIYSPEENIHAGTRYLRDMLATFKGDVTRAVAAYNAGPGAVKKYNNNVPPYRETTNYVRTVNRYYDMYRRPAAAKRLHAFTDANGCLTIYNEK